MRHVAIAILGAAALGLSGCGHKADNDAAGTNATGDDGATGTVGSNVGTGNSSGMAGNTAAAPATGGQGFANTAAASDAFEIATSQLAKTSAHSPAIKSFAAKIIEGHTASTASLKSAAASAKPAITPDPTLSADQQQRLDALKGKSGADFDKAYAAEQVTAHQATLDALRTYSASGDVPQLKAFAAKMVPTVTAHLNMAKGLKPWAK